MQVRYMLELRHSADSKIPHFQPNTKAQKMRFLCLTENSDPLVFLACASLSASGAAGTGTTQCLLVDEFNLFL